MSLKDIALAGAMAEGGGKNDNCYYAGKFFVSADLSDVSNPVFTTLSYSDLDFNSIVSALRENKFVFCTAQISVTGTQYVRMVNMVCMDAYYNGISSVGFYGFKELKSDYWYWFLKGFISSNNTKSFSGKTGF